MQEGERRASSDFMGEARMQAPLGGGKDSDGGRVELAAWYSTDVYGFRASRVMG